MKYIKEKEKIKKRNKSNEIKRRKEEYVDIRQVVVLQSAKQLTQFSNLLQTPSPHVAE